MATTTFQGKPKPANRPGHFFESRRHALQARGISTGHLSDKAVFRKYSALTSKQSDLDKIMARIPTKERRTLFLKQFNNLTENDKRFVITILRDTDGDKAIDLFDCNPYDPTKQDLKEFVQKADEKIRSGAEKGVNWVKEAAPKVQTALKNVGDKIEQGADQIRQNFEKGKTTEVDASSPTEYEMDSPTSAETEFQAEAEPEQQELDMDTEQPDVTIDEPTTRRQTKGFKAGYDQERRTQGHRATKRAYEVAGEEYTGDAEDDSDYADAPAKFGQILADLMGDYNSDDLAGLNEKELNTLAVRFQSRVKDAFLQPTNIFLEELKKREEAKMMVTMERAKIDAELEPARKQIRQEIAEIRNRAKRKEPVDIIERLSGW